MEDFGYKKWVKKFPSMPTKRQWTTVVCNRSIGMLIVGGGQGESGVLSTVEVMNTETHQWSTAADLPEPVCIASATICGDQIYMLGGADKDVAYTKSVYVCSVDELLQSCDSISLIAKFKRLYKASIWRQVADLPVVCSTCESFRGQLLTIGGYESRKPTTAVYMYNSTTNSWEIISHMTTGRYWCFTGILCDDKLVVMGGVTAHHGDTDTVEVATMSDFNAIIGTT